MRARASERTLSNPVNSLLFGYFQTIRYSCDWKDFSLLTIGVAMWLLIVLWCSAISIHGIPIRGLYAIAETAFFAHSLSLPKRLYALTIGIFQVEILWMCWKSGRIVIHYRQTEHSTESIEIHISWCILSTSEVRNNWFIRYQYAVAYIWYARQTIE